MDARAKPRRRSRGMSLVEQLAVLLILAALLAMAVPAFGGMLRRSRLRTAQATLMEALRATRQAAAYRQRRALFCPSEDGARCSGETRWDRGWLIALDRDGNDQPDDRPLRVGGGLAGVRIQGSAGRRHVAYLPDGSAPGSNLTLVLCAPGEQALAVVVSNWGRVRGARATESQAAGCLDR